MLSWSPEQFAEAQAMRDKICRGLGTDEPWFMEHMANHIGEAATAVHWRKPLRIDEIPKMANTPEVRERRGRG